MRKNDFKTAGLLSLPLIVASSVQTVGNLCIDQGRGAIFGILQEATCHRLYVLGHPSRTAIRRGLHLPNHPSGPAVACSSVRLCCPSVGLCEIDDSAASVSGRSATKGAVRARLKYDEQMDSVSRCKHSLTHLVTCPQRWQVEDLALEMTPLIQCGSHLDSAPWTWTGWCCGHWRLLLWARGWWSEASKPLAGNRGGRVEAVAVGGSDPRRCLNQ